MELNNVVRRRSPDSAAANDTAGPACMSVAQAGRPRHRGSNASATGSLVLRLPSSGACSPRSRAAQPPLPPTTKDRRPTSTPRLTEIRPPRCGSKLRISTNRNGPRSDLPPVHFGVLRRFNCARLFFVCIGFRRIRFFLICFHFNAHCWLSRHKLTSSSARPLSVSLLRKHYFERYTLNAQYTPPTPT